ncbi:hypothetical protein C2G38_2172390 [Gigaspora rosea]|uniref:Uncharacterized protein n=1 Tax=Gigaspora rosea TaxID=44941 RepID=A0A397VVK5_9GLOM|nr:hypothetical protein C2G38_2172390 [Gigaspora rosea]
MIKSRSTSTTYNSTPPKIAILEQLHNGEHTTPLMNNDLQETARPNITLPVTVRKKKKLEYETLNTTPLANDETTAQ